MNVQKIHIVTMATILEKIGEVQERINQALRNAGRKQGDATLLAVTKTFDADTVRQAYQAGLRAFGENKVQELALKQTQLPEDITWHLIGHLQQNKVKNAIANAQWIHSVDSQQLWQRISRLAAEQNREPQLLLQVNVSGEKTKSGVNPQEAEQIIAGNLQGPARLRGLMTIAPANATETELHQVFAGLRTLRDNLQQRLGIQLPELSMGMSHDYEIAISEGATIVRVGSAIFGHRDYSTQK